MVIGAPLKIGLIGCGFIAQTAHLPALAKAKGVKLSAVCDVSSDVLRHIQDQYGVERGYLQYEELLADDCVDAVLVSVPDEGHFEVASNSIRAGKAVLLEKPMVISVVEAQKLVDLINETRGVLQIGFMKRYDPGVQWARKFVGAQRDQILSFSGWYCDSAFRPEMQNAWFPPVITSPGRKRVDRKGEDYLAYKLRTHGSHLVDLARMMCGDIQSLSARSTEVQGNLSWQVLVWFKTGFSGTLELTLATRMDWMEGFRLHGQFGSIQANIYWPFYRRAAEVEVFDSRDGQYHRAVNPDGDLYRRQVEGFAQAILSGQPVSPDVEDGLANQKVLEAITQACRTNREIEVGSI